MTVAVTGAFGYSGRRIAERLLARGRAVVNLTGSPNRPNPFGDQVRILPLAFDDSQRLAVMFESAGVGHQLVEHFFAGMAEGRVTKVVCQAYCFGQALIEPKFPGNRPSYLGHLDAVGQACAVKVIKAGSENLRFAFQSAKG